MSKYEDRIIHAFEVIVAAPSRYTVPDLMYFTLDPYTQLYGIVLVRQQFGTFGRRSQIIGVPALYAKSPADNR